MIKADRRDNKRLKKKKMKVSGSSVKKLQEINIKKSESLNPAKYYAK